MSRLRAAGRGIVLLRRPTGRAKSIATLLSLLLLAVAVTYSIRNFPETDGVRWPLLLVVGLVAPACTIWLNAKEFQIQALIADQSVGLVEACRVSVLGTTANLLPLPGAVLVRTQALASGGSSYAGAAKINAASGLVWLGLSAVISAVGFAVLGSWVIASIGFASGVIAWGLGAVTATRVGATRRQLASISFVEASLTVLAAIRAYGVLLALSVLVQPSQALALAVSGAVASAAGVFPAGIGLREALSGVVATLVDLEPAVGIGAAAADRAAGLVVLLLANLMIVVADRRRKIPMSRGQAG